MILNLADLESVIDNKKAIDNLTSEVNTNTTNIAVNVNNIEDLKPVNKMTFTNFLLISPTGANPQYNKAYYYSKPADDSDWSGVPTAIQGALSLGYRIVRVYDTAHVLVELHEIYPVQGRVFTNFYNINKWSGWNSVDVNSDTKYNNEFVTETKSVSISATTATYTVGTATISTARIKSISNVAKSGYTLIGVVGVTATQRESTDWLINCSATTSSNSLITKYTLFAIGSSVASITDTVEVKLLYRKNL